MATLKTGWIKKIIDGVATKVFAISHAKCCYYDYTNEVTVYDKLKYISATDRKFSYKQPSSGDGSIEMGYHSSVKGQSSVCIVPNNSDTGGVSYTYGIFDVIIGGADNSTGSNNAGSYYGNFNTIIGGDNNRCGNYPYASDAGNSIIGGINNTIGQSAYSGILGGNSCNIQGNTGGAAIAGGIGINVYGSQLGTGHYNSSVDNGAPTSGTGTGTIFTIGNGTSSSRSNAFRVNANGTPYSQSALVTTGCDYAEYYEWEDKNPDNEDRRGYFVTLDGKSLKIAEPGDYIIGIVSGFPSIIGNGDENWRGRYIFDEFGSPIIEEVEDVVKEREPYYETVIDDEGNETEIVKFREVTKTITVTKWKENPDYDPDIPYIQRSERPEWAAVGMLGVLSVIDDGTCEVNGFCKVADGGIATASDNGYRVVKRVTDNIVEVVFK